MPISDFMALAESGFQNLVGEVLGALVMVYFVEHWDSGSCWILPVQSAGSNFFRSSQYSGSGLTAIL